ncbi:MAG: hypothetical protein ACO39U_05020, partial [Bacteroidia bacterium]
RRTLRPVRRTLRPVRRIPRPVRRIPRPVRHILHPVPVLRVLRALPPVHRAHPVRPRHLPVVQVLFHLVDNGSKAPQKSI